MTILLDPPTQTPNTPALADLYARNGGESLNTEAKISLLKQQMGVLFVASEDGSTDLAEELEYLEHAFKMGL